MIKKIKVLNVLKLTLFITMKFCQQDHFQDQSKIALY